MKNSAEAILKAAMPKLKEANEALNILSRPQIAEIK